MKGERVSLREMPNRALYSQVNTEDPRTVSSIPFTVYLLTEHIFLTMLVQGRCTFINILAERQIGFANLL